MGTATRLGGGYYKDRRGESKWFQTISEQQLYTVMSTLIQILKNNAYMYLMCDHEVLPYALMWTRNPDNMKKYGITYSKPLIWDKVSQGMGYH